MHSGKEVRKNDNGLINKSKINKEKFYRLDTRIEDYGKDESAEMLLVILTRKSKLFR